MYKVRYLMLLLFPLVGKAQTSNNRECLKSAIQYVNQKDAAGLASLISENSRLGDFPYPSNNIQFLDAILRTFPSIDDYHIQSEQLTSQQS